MRTSGILFSGIRLFLLICIFQGTLFTTHAIYSGEAEGNKKNLPISVAGIELNAELAITFEERILGLMYRDRLGDNEGMLFVFPEEDILSFWMKNTGIPLSIAFIKADGRITQIESMEPYSLDNHVSKEKVKYALEMKEGWFQAHNIKEGDIVKIPLKVDRKK